MTKRSFAKRQTGGAAAFVALAGSLLFLSGQPGATQTSPVAAPATASEIEKFCGNIADAARDRRYSIQTQELEALKAEIDTRVKQLEEKRAEYEHWMKLRQKFMEQASENVVSIYARMKPDAAAERLAEMKIELAASIMMKLQVKQSGLIMNEMESSTAAKLTGIMASAAREDDPT